MSVQQMAGKLLAMAGILGLSACSVTDVHDVGHLNGGGNSGSSFGGTPSSKGGANSATSGDGSGGFSAGTGGANSATSGDGSGELSDFGWLRGILRRNGRNKLSDFGWLRGIQRRNGRNKLSERR